jgi:hypothetical protein
LANRDDSYGGSLDILVRLKLLQSYCSTRFVHSFIHDMPRNPPAASTLRNRNRITNKSRLKIYQGSLDADVALIPDEDEERHLLNNLVAGVDAEDANVCIVPPRFSATSTIILWLCDPRIVLQIC